MLNFKCIVCKWLARFVAIFVVIGLESTRFAARLFGLQAKAVLRPYKFLSVT
jgi:hypothetical protein